MANVSSYSFLHASGSSAIGLLVGCSSAWSTEHSSREQAYGKQVCSRVVAAGQQTSVGAHARRAGSGVAVWVQANALQQCHLKGACSTLLTSLNLYLEVDRSMHIMSDGIAI